MSTVPNSASTIATAWSDGRWIADVSGHHERRAARDAHGGGHLSQLIDRASEQGDLNAVCRQSEGDGSPNAPACSGDERRAPFEGSTHRSASRAAMMSAGSGR